MSQRADFGRDRVQKRRTYRRLEDKCGFDFFLCCSVCFVNALVFSGEIIIFEGCAARQKD